MNKEEFRNNGEAGLLEEDQLRDMTEVAAIAEAVPQENKLALSMCLKSYIAGLTAGAQLNQENARSGTQREQETARTV